MDYAKLASVSLALLLVGGFAGAGVAKPLSTASQSQATGPADRPADAGIGALSTDAAPVAAQQGGQVNLSAVDTTATEAIRLAANRSDGKPVVVTLTTLNGTPVFNVSLLAQNRSVSQVTVDATDGTVTAVRNDITVADRRFLGGEAYAYEELRPATEAIRLLRNRTTGQVVNVGLRQGELVYGVALRTPEGSRTRALVAATRSPVLGIQVTNATGPTTTTA
ncbi:MULTISPECIES: PepSY domain-containing protein [Halorussus]|uniref:PepSY domain-containing protein n=1 Tax=Halorussus TaxID=1070314 RepID=UPI000E214AC7|nr:MULTISPECIES: PepSY domain-containing protein [Halorussus]NHN57896.1 PepSY domain-containing protein [Halorussus sp. JP-T4]